MLAEVEDMTDECFNGKSIQDVSPFTFAGAVLYMHKRRSDPSIDWQTFRLVTPMTEIAAVSEQLSEENENPTNGVVTKIV